MTFRKLKRLSLSACAGVLTLVAAACGSSSSTSGPAATVPSDLTIQSFTADFSYMVKLKDRAAAGHGSVGVILPDTTSSARYTAFDAPYLQKAFTEAGYSSSQFNIQNAQGDEAKEPSIAQADITNGATVLIMDPLNSSVGSQIQAYAQSHGVKVISYDRATFTGTNTYYVSFDNVQVGELIGKGFVKCVSTWNISSPQVFELDGGQNSDPNAIDFAKGYNDAIWGDKVQTETTGKTNSQGMKLVGEQVATDWKNDIGGTIFQQQFTAHPTINATVEANDGLANAVVQVLKNRGVGAKKIPTTGQDASPDPQPAFRNGSHRRRRTSWRRRSFSNSPIMQGEMAAVASTTATGEPLLKIRELDKHFGPVQALYHVDLDLPSGQVTALVGDNGAGKTVLTKCVAGIYQPDHGQVFWESHPVHIRNARDAARLGIETVYQDLALADNLDIVQNMFLGRERLSTGLLDEDNMERAAKETLAGLRVTTVRSIRQPVASLSGGQRQSIAVAKAVMWNSKLVIMDEPTAALGVVQTRQVLDLIKRLRDQGLAVMMISHNLNDVFEVADRIAVMYLGRLVVQDDASNFDRQSVVEYMTTGGTTRSGGTPTRNS